jgi:hypothetical protein
MTVSPNLLDPPNSTTQNGDERRVGVEFEFAGLGAHQTAQLIRDTFDGDIRKLSEHRYEVATPALKTFIVELDTRYAHPSADIEKQFGEHSAITAADRSVSRIVGDVSEGLVPTEIVTDPLPHTDLPKLDAITSALRNAGAEGTDAHITSGFGVHLNPEAWSLDAGQIRRLLQAYVIWSPRLRELIGVDPMRRVLPYVDPFPHKYVTHVLKGGYDPSLSDLIDDYIQHNPTRNRELDMLPLFKHVDDVRITNALDDDLIKARPAYHYRLPNMNLTDKNWSAVTEWNRWVMVERLAADEEALTTAAATLTSHADGGAKTGLIDTILLGLSS